MLFLGDNADRLACALAGTRVCARALAAYGKTLCVAEAAVRFDCREAFQIADDFAAEEDSFEITTDPANFSAVRDALEEKGYAFVEAEVSMVPQNYVTLTDEKQLEQIEKLLDGLDDNDDVMEVYHNWES